MHKSANADVGIIVDAGPSIGYGHAVRCLRLANALAPEQQVEFYPVSEACEEFLKSVAPDAQIQTPNSEISAFPPVVFTDLRETHGITARIRRHGSRHISIHDLGLGQCRSEIAIDGAITRLFPYPKESDQVLFLGPQYMITREPVARKEPTNTVLVTFGGGSTVEFAQKISEQLYKLGLSVIATSGFVGCAPMSEKTLEEAIATCRFAISGCGVSLYDLLASSVPTIAVAFDRLQLRTAESFHELGAVLSAGLMEKLTASKTLNHAIELMENRPLVKRMTQTGQMLVDGKGLSRVVDIARRQIWLTSQTKTYMTC